MSRISLLVASLVVASSLVGCGPSSSSASDPPAKVTVRRVDPGSVMPGPLQPDEDVGPIAFAFEGARGYIRATMQITGTSESTGPFIHDALFLASGEGRLSISVRKPWPGHERGRVTIRCEGGDEDSTVDYEPELWFGDPHATPVVVTAPDGDEPATIREGAELRLVGITAGPEGDATQVIRPGPISLSFTVTFDDEPIKPRVKAGVRAPR